jgi:hypothetical protein
MENLSVYPVPVSPLVGKRSVTRASAQQEFATLFYKELFKQAFKEQVEGSSLIGQEILIEKLAEEMARKNAHLLPAVK